MGKPWPWDMGFGVSCKKVTHPYCSGHRPILSSGS